MNFNKQCPQSTERPPAVSTSGKQQQPQHSATVLPSSGGVNVKVEGNNNVINITVNPSSKKKVDRQKKKSTNPQHHSQQASEGVAKEEKGKSTVETGDDDNTSYSLSSW